MTSIQLQSAWDQIRSNSHSVPRYKHPIQEYHNSLLARTHSPIHSSKRHNKNAAKGTGQILKRSYIKPQVGIERNFGNSVKPV